MKEPNRIQRTLKESVASLLHRSDYQPTYRESSYRRPFYLRLTPLTRFILILLMIVALAFMGVMANESLAARSSVVLLSDQLTAQPLPPGTLTPIVVVMANQDGTGVAPLPTQAIPIEPAPTATPDLSRAPWANQLFKQPDGTLMAPQKVIAQASLDLSQWYYVQRDLPIDDWLARRDTILNTYFTGSALQEMQGMEQARDLYAMNRAGRITIEIRRFTPDGLSAKAGIITRDWVSDVYDVQSRQLVARGKIKPDTLTISTIVYDQSSKRWKFAHTEEVTELTP
jgi:hypothetical protein